MALRQYASTSTLLLMLLAPGFASAQAHGTLVVNVSDFGNGSPIVAAEVFLPEANRITQTNEHGAAELRGLLSGIYEVRVRRLGYTAAVARVVVGQDSATVAVLLRPAAAGLDTMRVIASAITTERHRQFEMRRRRGLGRFLGPDELAKNDLEEFPIVAVGHFPGLALITGRGGQWQLGSRHGSCGVDTTYENLNSASIAASNQRGSQVAGAGSGARRTVAEEATSTSSCFSDHPCHVKLFLDDQPVAEADISIVHTSELYGVEFYSTGNAPPQYQVSGAACGVMLLWTKSGNSG